ncbi:hypothetical protein [Tumebacillus flagellatus]|uniref:Uncharacterized protein n=1 Tax=Tumebacillus flagellatus TaxID=1157490 RepID=A0A074LH05_9BACL|nr:hypothetical protein [Tumebacillus flagellatus]KEO81511.1 hypothetical protein EL26_20800 [Tumebacillus flagellatus]
MSTTATIQQPTVGRLVYYKSAGSADGTYPSVFRAALVTEVHSPTNVSLCVFNPTGLHFVQNVEQGDGPMQWDWMPYQKEQAALKAGLVNEQSVPKALAPLQPGDLVIYTDCQGNKHKAAVETAWSDQCANLYYTEPLLTGFRASIPTSVPLKMPGMSGNYFERVDTTPLKADNTEHIG